MISPSIRAALCPSRLARIRIGSRQLSGEAIPKLRPTPSPTRLSKYARRTGYLIAGIGAVYTFDRTLNASSITRNFRTLWTCLMITYDYKMNFTPEKSEQIPQLHERVADRVYNLLTTNGGLYIKIGQAIGANAAMLPRPMQVKFASLFDDAPQIPYSVVHDVFVKELGRPPSGPDGVFEIFEEKAVASASIAQVHKAKLWPRIGPDGKPEKEERWVAVKVQKPDVGKQMEWDLGAYRAIMWMFENVAFDLPVYFAVDFVSDHLRQELDFVREANSARLTAEFVANEPLLRDKVYIPKVYPEYSTKKVMTAEWIDGVRLSDKESVYKLMGEKLPGGFVPKVTDPVDLMSATSLVASSSLSELQSSIEASKLSSKPLKGGLKSIMQTMVELFSAQMFDWGWVHCDPHPGNVLIRPSPSDPSKPQVVLLDHGLYVKVEEDFRREWVDLWRAMLAGDYSGVQTVIEGWGMALPDLMASFTLMKPTILKNGRKKKEQPLGPDGKAVPQEPKKPLTQYEMSVKMKQKLKEFLQDTDRMPKVLIFLTRNMRMVQGNNQSFGSPVNRIKITGYWASRSQTRNMNLTFSERVREWYRDAVFRTVMLSLDIAFYQNMFVTWLRRLRYRLHLGGTVGKGGGFEEELENAMRGLAKDALGVEVGEGAFSG